MFYDTLPGQGDFFQNGTLAPPFQPLTEVDFAGADPVRDRRSAAASPVGFPAGLIFIGWGPDFTTPMVQHYNVTAAAAGRQLLGPRGRLRRIARLQPADLHGGEPDDSDPVADAGVGPRAAPGVQPRAADASRPPILLQLAAGERAHAPVARRQHARVATRSSHAVDDVSGLNIGGESRPMLPVTIGDQASIDAALAREKGDALFDARHRFVLSFGYELPRLEAQQRRRPSDARRLAGRTASFRRRPASR